MRALFYSSDAEWTGALRVFAAAARGLAARGYQITFVCGAGGTAELHVAALGFEALALPHDRGWLATSGRLAQALRDGFVEVVFVHTEEEHWTAAAAVRRAGRGAVVRRFGAGEVAHVGRAGRTAARLAGTGYLCTWKEQARALEGVRAPLGVHVADVGIDAPAVARAEPLASAYPFGHLALGGDGDEASLDERRIVCVYEPGARTRAATMLRTAAMLAPRHPELRVLLVGPGAEDEGLRMHAAALGVPRVVSHVGVASDLAPLLASADLGWVVAGGDDGAYGTLDCMAARLPVLAEVGSVAARYVADGIAGVHIAPGDVPGTAAVIAELLAHDADRRAMGQAGGARLARVHGEAAMVEIFARAADSARDRTRWSA